MGASGFSTVCGSMFSAKTASSSADSVQPLILILDSFILLQ